MKIIKYIDKKEKPNRMYGYSVYENSDKILSASFEKPRARGRVKRVELQSTDTLD